MCFDERGAQDELHAAVTVTSTRCPGRQAHWPALLMRGMIKGTIMPTAHPTTVQTRSLLTPGRTSRAWAAMLLLLLRSELLVLTAALRSCSIASLQCRCRYGWLLWSFPAQSCMTALPQRARMGATWACNACACRHLRPSGAKSCC